MLNDPRHSHRATVSMTVIHRHRSYVLVLLLLYINCTCGLTQWKHATKLSYNT